MQLVFHGGTVSRLFVTRDRKDVESNGHLSGMCIKRRKNSQTEQIVLVGTLDDVSWGYFAICKRNHDFSVTSASYPCK